ncbi:MAG: hypothetical protein ACW98Y_19515 [Candidatus Thorarchaeota archaeon]|jgi:DNA-binding transcriptional regulator GbsR (MarR family)
MKLRDNESYGILSRILSESAKLLGLQENAGLILSAIYWNETCNDQPVSTEDICTATGLSRSYISSICMRLESLGIIFKASPHISRRRGRRKLSYSLRVELDFILRLGIRKYLANIRSALNDFRTIRNISDRDDSDWIHTKNQLDSEISQFLHELHCFQEK